jgi:hypothetical protein
MPIQGSCHCGKISYTLDEDPPTAAIECNCGAKVRAPAAAEALIARLAG